MIALSSVTVPFGSVMVSGAIDTAARFATPVPVRLTLTGVTVTPVPATVSVPVCAPVNADVGANCSLTVHEAPTASVLPQLGAPAGNVPLVTRVNVAEPVSG